MFQYDRGPPKHILELRSCINQCFSLHLIGPNGENCGFEGVFISLSYTFFRLTMQNIYKKEIQGTDLDRHLGHARPAFILQKSFDGPNIFRSRLWTRVH